MTFGCYKCRCWGPAAAVWKKVARPTVATWAGAAVDNYNNPGGGMGGGRGMGGGYGNQPDDIDDLPF